MGVESFGLENVEAFEASLVPDEPSPRGRAASSDAASSSSRSSSGKPSDAGSSASGSRSASGSSSRSRDQVYERWIGKRLARFRLIRLMGSGAMGVVFQAKDLNLHRITALKVLRRQIKDEDGAKQVERFLLEARTAAGLDHPSIAYIYEINEHAGWWFIAMEFLDGGDLRQLVKAHGPISPGRAAVMLVDVANGLAVAHDAKMIHRDIKPANLMLNRHGRCKVVDFGLVKLHSANNPFQDDDHTIIGTPYYVAPEVIRKRGAVSASDIYGLGATMHLLLTGRPPFLGRSVKEVLIKHLKAKIPDVRERCPNCPESLAALVRQTLAKEPEERPTAAEVAAALHQEAAVALADYPMLSSSSSSSSSLDAAAMLATATGSTTAAANLSSTQLTGLGASTTAARNESVTPEASVTVAAASNWLFTHRWPVALGSVAVMGVFIAWMALSASYQRQALRSHSIAGSPSRDHAIDTITNDIGMKLARIPAGHFTMGSSPDEPDRNNDERPVEVSISRGFSISVTEVTQAQWASVMGSDTLGGLRFVGDELPVPASWFEAAEFCRVLSQRENQYYRLPTEAEWEYACRAGSTTRFHTGRGLGPAQANLGTEAFSSSRGRRPLPVGSFPPSRWGLYDMHGNVMEWCADWKGEYSIGPLADPVGPEDGSQRVIRGGSWACVARVARSANRWSNPPTSRTDYIGFRVVLEPHGSPPAGADSYLAAPHDATAHPAGARPRERWPATLPAVVVDPALPDYKPGSAIDRRLHSVGSGTMSHLMSLWKNRFGQWHEQFELRHDGLGSSTTMPALIEGIAHFGPMSRPLNPAETRAFQSERGYEPTQLQVGVDAVAIYVHPSNPIVERGLTLAEFDAILSTTRNRGHAQDIAIWGDLALPTAWRDAPIHVYSRGRASGTCGLLEAAVLLNGTFKTTIELMDSGDVVDAVAGDPHGIGCSSVGYFGEDVAVVPLVAEDGPAMVTLDLATVHDGTYPLTRPLFLTLDLPPDQPPSPLYEEFLRFVFSKQGQESVAQAGFLPLDARLAEQELSRAGAELGP